MAVIGQRCAQAKPSKELIPTGRIGADPCDTEHRLETSQGAGESRETNTESRTCRTRGHVPKEKKRTRGRPKEEVQVPKKTKASASAWRNKRNKNRKWRQYKDQSKRKPKWKDIARS